MAKVYRFGFKRLDVYQVAVEHFEWTCDIVARSSKVPFKVVNQSVGASMSVMGNIGEAHGRETKPGETEQHYRYAQGSTFESATHLDAFSALKLIDDDEYNAEEERLARIAMMLTRLIQKQRRRRRQLRRIRRQKHAGSAAEGSSNAREASPGARSAARIESRRVPEGAQRPTGIESPPSGVSKAAPAAVEIEHRTPESTDT